MRGHRDLKLAVTVAVVGALLSLLLPWTLPRLIAVAPLALFLPGYAISSAIFARREIDTPRLLVLSVGLSLATLAILPLLLNYLPGGIGGFSWALGLTLIVVAAARGAALGRGRRKVDLTFTAPRVELRERLLLATGAVAVAIAAVVMFTPFPAPNAIGYTELWIKPAGGPVAPKALVGIASREQEPASYAVEFRVGGRDELVDFQRVDLDPGEERKLVLPLPPQRRGHQLKVGVTLFIEGLSEPYRRVSAWVPRPRT